MVDTHPKRPSAFGEGTVPKKQKGAVSSKPRSADGRLVSTMVRPVTTAFLQGGFSPKLAAQGTKKPASSILLRPQDRSMFPNDIRPVEETSERGAGKPVKMLQTHKQPLLVSGLPTDPEASGEPSKSFTEISKSKEAQKLATPLKSRSRPPEFLQKESTAPMRTVTPFRALAPPVLKSDGPGTRGCDAPIILKRLAAPNFGSVAKDTTNMMAVTALDIPAMDIMQMGDLGPVGEKLELERGLLVSPEKGNKKKGRFLRDGLAQRAQILIQRSSTSLVLWRKELEPRMKHESRLRSDIKLRIIKVIHVSRAPTNQSRTLAPIQSILCKCETVDCQNHANRHVLFSFGRSDATLKTGREETLVEGSEVFVWKPWEEIVVSGIVTILSYRFMIIPKPSIDKR